MNIAFRHLFLPSVCCALMLVASRTRAMDDVLDKLDEHLTISAFEGNVSARLSGSLDTEGYYFRQPAPSFIDTDHDFLFNTRLTFFVDAQIGKKLYFFAQTRIDRGFDPADAVVQTRLDEYALRFTPWDDGRLNIQIGKFATIVGKWSCRHGSWDDSFITAPLPYENLTSIWDNSAADSASTLLGWYESGKDVRIPIIWGPAYSTGAAVTGRIGEFDYAAEIKNTPLSSRPNSWNLTEVGFENPTYSGRIGWRPDAAWEFGLSGSTGTYLLPVAVSSLAAGTTLDDYRQTTVAQDVTYAWHHWQVWAEFFETRYEIPDVGNADTFAYFVETKYQFTPQLFGALRWNQQVFNSFTNDSGESVPWSYNSWRIDTAVTYRFTTHIQAKLQYSFLRQERAERENQHLVAVQFTVHF